MSRDDMERVNKLHLEIRKEAHSERRRELLWTFMERLAQEMLIFRAQAEGELREGCWPPKRPHRAIRHSEHE